MTYTYDKTIVWTDSMGADHVERFTTVSAMITRVEELEANPAVRRIDAG